MRLAALTPLVVFAVVAAGCGGTQGTGAGASDMVPASAPVFIQIDTDPGSAQWKAVNDLAAHFPRQAKGRRHDQKAAADLGRPRLGEGRQTRAW
jgi:hypothetical protein